MNRILLSPHAREIQDSPGFWIPWRGIGIPGTEFRILCQWNLILNSNRSWDSGFLELYSRFADSTSKRNVEVPQVKESRFLGMRRVLINSSSKFERYYLLLLKI